MFLQNIEVLLMSDMSYAINKTNAKQFCKYFHIYCTADDYVRFTTYCNDFFCSVDIIKTSKQIYRAIVFVAHYGIHKCAEYLSFHSLADLCFYLDTLSSQLV